MMKHINLKHYKLFLFALLCTMLWGSAIPSIKLGYLFFEISSTDAADLLLFAGIRFLGAGFLILIPYFILTKGTAKSVNRELLRHSTVLGLIQTAGQYFFMYIGLAHTTGVNASVLNAIGSLLYILLARIIYRDEKLSLAKWSGCVIGFSGILMNSLVSQKLGMLSWRGDALILIANVCVAVGFLYSKHGVKNTNAFLLTGTQMGIGGTILLVIGLLWGGNLPTVTVKGLLLLLYLMAVSAVAFSLWTILLRDYPSALVGMFNFLTPIFGSIFSYIFSRMGLLDEMSAFTMYTVLALVCVALGIFLSSFKRVSKSDHEKSL